MWFSGGSRSPSGVVGQPWQMERRSASVMRPSDGYRSQEDEQHGGAAARHPELTGAARRAFAAFPRAPISSAAPRGEPHPRPVGERRRRPDGGDHISEEGRGKRRGGRRGGGGGKRGRRVRERRKTRREGVGGVRAKENESEERGARCQSRKGAPNFV